METRRRGKAAPTPPPKSWVEEVGEAPPTPAGISPLMGRPRRVSFSGPEALSAAKGGSSLGWGSLGAAMLVLGVIAFAAGAWVGGLYEERLRDPSGKVIYQVSPDNVNNCPEVAAYVPVGGALDALRQCYNEKVAGERQLSSVQRLVRRVTQVE